MPSIQSVAAVSPGAAGQAYRPAPTIAQAAAGNYIRLGDRGPAVTVLKEALAAEGLPLAAHDVFDIEMDTAVRDFQVSKGLSRDGMVGRNTLRRLGLLERPQLRVVEPSAGAVISGGGVSSPVQPALTPPADTPSRTGNGGRDFLLSLGTGPARESAILDAVERGNVPSFLTDFVDVPVEFTDRNGVSHTGSVRVSPDYVSIGTDDDYVRMPMGQPTAEAVAEHFDCVLPTRLLVNRIYQAAEVELSPRPMTPGPQMTSNATFLRHNDTVEAQRRAAGAENGALIAGHKKDVVLSNRQLRNPGKVAIYGWHQQNGRPIQPLSTVHIASYADYSHGVRLVSKIMIVDGQPMRIDDVLRDPNLAGLISDEGPIVR